MTDVVERFRLAGRVALVTGGARGLGNVMARALASAGARVAITSRDRAAATAAAAELGGGAVGLGVDVRDASAVTGMIAETVGALGGLHILVNNAGTTRRGPFDGLAEDDWDVVVDTNLKGTWLACRAARPALREASGGRIINVASMFSQVGHVNRCLLYTSPSPRDS